MPGQTQACICESYYDIAWFQYKKGSMVLPNQQVVEEHSIYVHGPTQ
jgi:hypothetical protein